MRYVNDSKATNVEATLQALASFDAPLHVILGGSLKGADFAPLAAPLAHGASAVLPDRRGRARAAARAHRLRASSCVDCGTLARAVEIAASVTADGRRRAALAGLRLVRPVPATTRRAASASASSSRRWRESHARPGARRRAAARGRRDGARRVRRGHGLLGLVVVHAARAPRGLRRARPRGAVAARPARLPAHRRARSRDARRRGGAAADGARRRRRAQRRAALAESARRLHAAALRARQGRALRVRRRRALGRASTRRATGARRCARSAPPPRSSAA